MEVVTNNYHSGDQRLVDKIVYELKSQGIFDQFRKECIADVDTKPAYQNLRQRVEGNVTGFLSKQTWNPDMNKNQVREMLRKNIHESGFLEIGVERIVDQVVNPKIHSVFHPMVEDVAYKYLGLERPARSDIIQDPPKVAVIDLLPTDLEAVSPESVTLDDTCHYSNNDSQDMDGSGSKGDEDESPPFELIEGQATTSLQQDDQTRESLDSRLSGISGLVIHDSRKVIPMEVCSQDSRMSLNDSETHLSVVTDDSTKMEICDSSEDKPMEAEMMDISDQESSDKIIPPTMENSSSQDVEFKKQEETSKSTDQKKVDDKIESSKKSEDKKYDSTKIEKEKHRSDDSKSSKHKSSDRHRSKHEKDDKRSKDKERDRSSSKHSKESSKDSKDSKSKSEKDKDARSDKSEKDKYEKSKSDKEKTSNEKAEKHKSEKDKGDSHKSDKHRSEKNKHDKSKHKSDKDKNDNEKNRTKDKSDKDKERSDKEKSSKDKVEKDKEKKEKDKSESKHKNGKEKSDRSDKDRNDKHKSDREKSRSDKERTEKDKSEKSERNDKSENEKGDRQDKEKNKTDKDKSDKEKKDKTDKNKSDKEKKDQKHSSNRASSNSSSRDKTSSKKEKDSVKDKDRSKLSSNSKTSDKSHSDTSKDREQTKSKDDSKSKDDQKKKSPVKKDEKHSSHKKHKDKKKDKDDHYSAKDKNHDRRSTDRDSNDGRPAKRNHHSPAAGEKSNSHKSSQNSFKTSQDSTTSSGSGESGNSDFVEESKIEGNTLGNIKAASPVVSPSKENIKLIKPKFASNFQEARRIMKIRKQLSKLEKHSQLALTNVETLSPVVAIPVQNLEQAGPSHKFDDQKRVGNHNNGQVSVQKKNKKKILNVLEHHTKLKQSQDTQLNLKQIKEKLKAKITNKKNNNVKTRLKNAINSKWNNTVKNRLKQLNESSESEEEASKNMENNEQMLITDKPATITSRKHESPTSPEIDYVTPPLKDTVITMESWNALEAKLNQELLHVNYDSYDCPDLDYSISPIKLESQSLKKDIPPHNQNALTTFNEQDNKEIISIVKNASRTKKVNIDVSKVKTELQSTELLDECSSLHSEKEVSSTQKFELDNSAKNIESLSSDTNMEISCVSSSSPPEAIASPDIKVEVDISEENISQSGYSITNNDSDSPIKKAEVDAIDESIATRSNTINMEVDESNSSTTNKDSNSLIQKAEVDALEKSIMPQTDTTNMEVDLSNSPSTDRIFVKEVEKISENELTGSLQEDEPDRSKNTTPDLVEQMKKNLKCLVVNIGNNIIPNDVQEGVSIDSSDEEGSSEKEVNKNTSGEQKSKYNSGAQEVEENNETNQIHMPKESQDNNPSDSNVNKTTRGQSVGKRLMSPRKTSPAKNRRKSAINDLCKSSEICVDNKEVSKKTTASAENNLNTINTQVESEQAAVIPHNNKQNNSKENCLEFTDSVGRIDTSINTFSQSEQIESTSENNKITVKDNTLKPSDSVDTNDGVDITISHDDSDGDCKFFETNNSRADVSLRLLRQKIESLEEYISKQQELITRLSVNNGNSPKKRGRKRKIPEDNDLVNNNSNKKCTVVNDKDFKIVTRRHLSSKAQTPSSSEVSLNDSINLELSPAENLNSADVNRDRSEILSKKRKTNKVGNQRYSSADLYKPRPNFANTRRSKGTSSS